MSDAKGAILRAMWREKMHVEPRALELTPPTIRASYAHIWEPAELLLSELEPFPLGLLCRWYHSTRGHLVFTHAPSRYEPGSHPWRERVLQGVCYLSLVDWRRERKRIFTALFHLLDHLLGSDALPDGPWLSDGAGVTAPLRDVGRCLKRIHALGHWQDAMVVHNSREYLAETWWMYLQAPHQLNVVDPLIHRLYRSTLMNEPFWRSDVLLESTER